MKTKELINGLTQLGIETYVGVPDSTLQCFCDDLNQNMDKDHHIVTVNEGAAVGLGAGCYLASGKPTCIYMQNSGIGNALNPIASLVNEKVYDIPMLFLVGYRGEPGVHDEPQHIFQGEITLPLLELLDIEYVVLSKDTTNDELCTALEKANDCLTNKKQFAFVIKKGTFEKEERFVFDNGYHLVRETAIQEILKQIKQDDILVSTTGKISREVYEQCDQLFGHHDQVFLTVGSMGHASMIALGIAKQRKERVICIDGDGAALMHMGSMALIANETCSNLIHITLNNQAHESVGGMPTDCQATRLADVAKACGYAYVRHIESLDDIHQVFEELDEVAGPAYIEVMVSLSSRGDLGRPKESAVENKKSFMKFLGQEEQ